MHKEKLTDPTTTSSVKGWRRRSWMRIVSEGESVHSGRPSLPHVVMMCMHTGGMSRKKRHPSPVTCVLQVGTGPDSNVRTSHDIAVSGGALGRSFAVRRRRLLRHSEAHFRWRNCCRRTRHGGVDMTCWVGDNEHFGRRLSAWTTTGTARSYDYDLEYDYHDRPTDKASATIALRLDYPANTHVFEIEDNPQETEAKRTPLADNC